jgi:subtilisin family serine protease
MRTLVRHVSMLLYSCYLCAMGLIILFLFGTLLSNLTNAAVAGRHTAKVAIIDTGLDLTDERFEGLLCPGSKDFTGRGIRDEHGHGTHIAGLIKKYAGPDADYCLLILKYYEDKATSAVNAAREVAAVEYAVQQHADYVNISAGGPMALEPERLAIMRTPKTLWIVAAGNEHRSLDTPGEEYYPASYFLPNMIVVGALKSGLDGLSIEVRLPSSNWGKRVTTWEVGENVLSTLPGGVRTGLMSGTSQATAVHTGKLLRARCSSTSCSFSR